MARSRPSDKPLPSGSQRIQFPISGPAAPLFVMGSRVKPGRHGASPNLAVGRNEDLKFSPDFRRVYSTVLDRWLGCKSAAILGANHAPLGFA